MELAAQTVEFSLKRESGGTVFRGTASRTIEAGGRIAVFINELFPAVYTTRFRGEVLIQAQGGRIAVMALEFDPNGAFTTLPASPVEN